MYLFCSNDKHVELQKQSESEGDGCRSISLIEEKKTSIGVNFSNMYVEGQYQRLSCQDWVATLQLLHIVHIFIKLIDTAFLPIQAEMNESMYSLRGTPGVNQKYDIIDNACKVINEYVIGYYQNPVGGRKSVSI